MYAIVKNVVTPPIDVGVQTRRAAQRFHGRGAHATIRAVQPTSASMCSACSLSAALHRLTRHARGLRAARVRPTPAAGVAPRRRARSSCRARWTSRSRTLVAALEHATRGARRRLDVLARHDRRLSGRRLEDAQGHGERRGGDGARRRTVPSRSAIINQGTAGGHDARRCTSSTSCSARTSVNLGSFKTGIARAAPAATSPSGARSI